MLCIWKRYAYRTCGTYRGSHRKKGLRAFLVEAKSGAQYNVRNLLRGTDDWDPLGQREYLPEAETEHLPVQLVLSRGSVELTEEHRSQTLSARVKYFSGETQEHPELVCEITEDGSRIRLQRQGQELTLYGEITVPVPGRTDCSYIQRPDWRLWQRL